MFVFSHKMVFIENEAALLCVIMQERAFPAIAKRILAWKRDISIS